MSDISESLAAPRPTTSPSYAAKGALVAVLALLLAPTGANAAPPISPVTSDPADAAAGWLTGELADGNHIETVFGGTAYPDYGITADSILAFAAAGSAGDAANAASDYLAANAGLYIGDGTVESYAGSLAKLILVADVMGRDPSSFGGRDLVSELLAREQPDGRYADASAFGDYSNPFSQSLAIISLQRVTADGPSDAALDFFASIQCADGGFVADLTSLPCATGEVDASAMALQGLLAGGRAADDVVAFLLDQQAPDGSFSSTAFGDPPVVTANSNSTGLAAQALRVAGQDAAADAALTWLSARQLGPSAPVEQQGAFAFDATGFDPANVTRATTQAILGVSGIGFADLVAPTDPQAYGLATPDGGTVLPPPPPPSTGPVPPVEVPAELPATGAAPEGLLAVGATLLGLGAAVTMLGRRRAQPSA